MFPKMETFARAHLEITSATHADATPVNGAGSNVAGWDHVLYVIRCGTLTGALDVKLQTAPDSSGSPGAYADCSPAIAMTQIAATEDNTVQLWRVNVKESSQIDAWARPVITPAGGTAVVEVTALRVGPYSTDLIFSDAAAGTYTDDNVQTYNGQS